MKIFEKYELRVNGRGIDGPEGDEKRVAFILFNLLFLQLLISCRVDATFAEE